MLFGVSVPPEILVIGVLGGINLLYAYCSLLGDVYWEVSVGSESFVRWTTPLSDVCYQSITIRASISYLPYLILLALADCNSVSVA